MKLYLYIMYYNSLIILLSIIYIMLFLSIVYIIFLNIPFSNILLGNSFYQEYYFIKNVILLGISILSYFIYSSILLGLSFHYTSYLT